MQESQKGLQIDKSKWHAKVFFFALGIVDEFTQSYNANRIEKYGTNLYHYIRTIFVYLPGVIALHLAMIAFVLTAIIGFPIYVFGFDLYLMMLGIVVFIGVTGYGINKSYNAFIEPRIDYGATLDFTKPSMISLVVEYIMAQKKKICPIVLFVKNKEDANV